MACILVLGVPVIQPVLSHSRIGTGSMHGWGPGSPMSGALARMGPLPANVGWGPGSVPPLNGATPRLVHEGKGKAACGAPSKMAGCGMDGEEPVNVEGCGCGGGCGGRGSDGSCGCPPERADAVEGSALGLVGIYFFPEFLLACTADEEKRWLDRKKCLEAAFRGNGAEGTMLAIDLWCRTHDPRVARNFEGWPESLCECKDSKWLLDDPSEWPETVRMDLSLNCDYMSQRGRIMGSTMEGAGEAIEASGAMTFASVQARCGIMHWDFDIDALMGDSTRDTPVEDHNCFYNWDDRGNGGPCEPVYETDPDAAQKCGNYYAAAEGPGATVGQLAISLLEALTAKNCGCYGVGDFGTSCNCGAASVSCKLSRDMQGCYCEGTCYAGADCAWPGNGSFSTVMQTCGG